MANDIDVIAIFSFRISSFDLLIIDITNIRNKIMPSSIKLDFIDFIVGRKSIWCALFKIFSWDKSMTEDDVWTEKIAMQITNKLSNK